MPSSDWRRWRNAAASNMPVPHDVARRKPADDGGDAIHIRQRGVPPLSMPVEISPEVPVENSPLRCRAELNCRTSATVLEAVKGRAPRRAPHAVSSLDRSCAPGRWSPSGRKASRGYDRLRRVEQKAVQDGGIFGGRPRRRGVWPAGLACCGWRRLSGSKSACWRSR